MIFVPTAILLPKLFTRLCKQGYSSLKECDESNLNKSIQKALQKIQSYTRRYIDKGVLCGEDLYTFAMQELNHQKESAIKRTTQYECEIAIDVVGQLKQKTENLRIIEYITNKYIEKNSSELPNRVVTYPKELTYNPNAREESETQLQIFDSLSNKISKGSVYMPAIHIKLLNLVSKYYSIQRKGISITLYDYLEYELTQKLSTCKRGYTIFEYQQALNIVKMLKDKISVDSIYEHLRVTSGLR